ncbi:MAG: GAF domain-containing protein, partial [Nitrospirota bacterium]
MANEMGHIGLYEVEIRRLKNELEKYGKFESNLLLFAEEPDPTKLVGLVAQTAARLIRADTVAVPLLSPDNLEVHYGHVCGRNSEKFPDSRIPIEKSGLCCWVMDNRKSILCENLIEDLRVSSDLAMELGYSTAALAPLISRGKIIGGLSAFRDGPPFTDEDRAELAKLAGYAAVAIENARFVEEILKERKRLNAIIDGMEDGIVLISHEGLILKANKAVEKYLPIKFHELVGVYVQELINYPPLDLVFAWNIPAPPGKRCWEIKDCDSQICPMHMKDFVRCWVNSGEGCCPDGNRLGEGMK